MHLMSSKDKKKLTGLTVFNSKFANYFTPTNML